MIHLVRPSVRPMACADRWRPRGIGRLRSPRPCRLASVSVSTGPGDFRIGEHDGGNRPRLERRRLAGQGLDGHLALVAGLVGEHRFARYVADGQDVRIAGAALRVDYDKAARIELNLGLLQP